MVKISVIVPVYKVEDYVGKCVRSLMEQTLDELEFIFVDDCSPDNSMEIVRKTVKEYPERSSWVKIVTHERNRGLPAARNTGLAEATGEFVYHCDSDDWIERDMMESMYAVAKEKNADMVYCDFFLTFVQNERYMHNPTYQTGEDVLKAGYCGGVMKYNVWNKIVRRNVYTDHGIVFPEGHAMGEDMTMIQLTALCGRVSHVEKAFYHYVKMNSNAYSNSAQALHLEDIKFNLARTEKFLAECFGNKYEEYMAYFKLNTKLPFLISDSQEDYRIWSSLYPEANPYIMKNQYLPFRTKLLQWMASKGFFCGVRLYNRLVYSFIYGKIFK